MPPIFILIIILGVIAAIVVGIAGQRAIAMRWSEAAARLGLQLVPGGVFSYPRIDGLLGRHRVSIRTITTGGGNNQQRYTRYQVDYPSLDLGLQLARQTAIGGFFRRIVGAQDIEIGDEAFDQAFTVKSADPQQLLAFLTTRRRQSLTRLLLTFPKLEVTDTAIRIDVLRVQRDPDVLASTLRRLASVAETLSDAPDLDDAVSARESGDLNDALQRMRSAVEEQPDDLERRLLEIDTLAAAGSVEEMSDRIAEAEQIAPADPEVRGWRQSVAEPTPSTGTPPASVAAQELTEELFGDRAMSFVVRDRFAAGYAGTKVRWPGTVKSARRYDFDGDFGRGPGVKAVVTVASLEHDLFGASDIDAIVELPESAPDLNRGDTVAIEGTLTAVDALMRNFTVRQASLV